MTPPKTAHDDQCAACGVLQSNHAIQDSAHTFRPVNPPKTAAPSAGAMRIAQKCATVGGIDRWAAIIESEMDQHNQELLEALEATHQELIGLAAYLATCVSSVIVEMHNTADRLGAAIAKARKP